MIEIIRIVSTKESIVCNIYEIDYSVTKTGYLNRSISKAINEELEKGYIVTIHVHKQTEKD